MGILDKYLEEYQKAKAKKDDPFVVDVACTREIETCCLPSSSSSFIKKNNISFVRASNKCNKSADCDNCPAAGLSDSDGSGKWCFHTAFYLGKSGKAIPCKTAQHDCPLSDEEKLQ